MNAVDAAVALSFVAVGHRAPRGGTGSGFMASGALGDGVDADGAGSPLQVGQQVVVNPNSSCGACAYCGERRPWLCESFAGIGSSTPGGFAEFVLVPRGRCML